MPMQVTSQVLFDGLKSAMMQFTGVNDGTGGETLEAKVIPADLAYAPASVKPLVITYEVSGGLLRMIWDADDPVGFLDLAGAGIIDYARIGGMKNGGGPTATGNILFTTVGFDSGSSYAVTMDMRKKY